MACDQSVFQPVSAVFYPVEVLPGWLQAVAGFIPSAHVFEGMRQVINHAGFPYEHLAWAAVLNCAYILAAIVFFAWNFKKVKEKGLLVKIGE